jgi:hypothetical protein
MASLDLLLWHAVREMKGSLDPRFFDKTFERIRKFAAFSFDHVAILHFGARKSQMSNSGQHTKVADGCLLRFLPMSSSGVATIVSITRRQEIPVNHQLRLVVIVIVIVATLSFLRSEVLLQIGQVPKNQKSN